MWIDAMALFPLVIYGLECIVDKGRFRLYTFSLAAVMLTNYYMAYIICLFSVLYFIFYYFSRYTLTSKLVNISYADALGNEAAPVKRKGREVRRGYTHINSRLLNSGLRFVLASVAAGGLAAFMIVPLFFILQSCSATSGTFPAELKTYFNIFDFIANHLVSLEPTIRSSGEDVLPNVYCGVATAILAPLYLYSKHYSRQEKISYVILLGVLFASFYTNYANYIWHGFHFPNDLPYRFSYTYSFVLLTMAFKALIHIEDFKPSTLLTAGISALAFLIVAQKVGSKNVTNDTVTIAVLFIVLHTFVLLMMNNEKFRGSAVALLLFCSVVAEASVGNTDHYVMQQQKKYFVEDYDDFRVFKAKLDSVEEQQFYRMDLTDLRARMDPSWYNYNGISVFSSMAYEKTSNLMSYLGMDGNFINSYSSNGYQTPLFYMMTGMKYIVDNSDNTPVMNPEYYTKSTELDKFKAYRFNYNTNLAFCVSDDVRDWTYTYSNPFDVQNEFFYLATGNEDLFVANDIDELDYDNVQEIDVGYEVGSLNAAKINGDVSGSFTATYEIEEDGDYFIFLESPDIDEVTINYGETVYTHNFSSEHIVGIGYVEEGEDVYVSVPINSASTHVDMYLYKLDHEKFQNGYEMLKQGEMEYDLFDETHIKGKVKADEDCLLYTSIPYDESWIISVDGRKLTVAEMREDKIGDGFLGVKLTAGKHDIEFRFVPRGALIGAASTCVTALLLIAVFVLLRRSRICERLKNGYDVEPVEETVLINSIIVDEEQEYEPHGNDQDGSDNQEEFSIDPAAMNEDPESPVIIAEDNEETPAEGFDESAGNDSDSEIAETDQTDEALPESAADEDVPTDAAEAETTDAAESSDDDHEITD